MRINVYHEELTDEVRFVEKVAETGIVYFGIRMFQASAPELHHTPEDDDRSAITLWFGTKQAAAEYFARLASRFAESETILY
jgi:hypothetical protein